MCIIHQWREYSVWYPSKEAKIVEFNEQGRECTKCGEKEIWATYFDKLARPYAYKQNKH